MTALWLQVGLWCAAAAAGLGLPPAFANEVSTDSRKYNTGKYGALPMVSYRSSKNVSPMLNVNTWNETGMSEQGSHIFMRHDAHQGRWHDSAAIIFDAHDLSAVYINRSYESVFDFRVQKNYGESFLTFYGGPRDPRGHGNGFSHVLDSSYREAYTLTPAHLDAKSDIHEFQLTGHGSGLVTVYDTIDFDTHPYGGPETGGKLLDCLFQEVDLETGEALFTWRASEHVSPEVSNYDVDTPWDYFHMNSIEKTEAGNYLISARHAFALYLVNGTNGDIIWTLGGVDNDFQELPPAGDFSNSALSMAWQHHARFYRGNESEITVFDNHDIYNAGHSCKANCSRGIHIAIDTESDPPTVQLLNEFLHPKGLLSPSQGSVQALENGNFFVGWGWNPVFTEHTPEGDVVLDVQFSPWMSKFTNDLQLDNYRAYKMDWKATPYWDPELYVEHKAGGSVIAYVSWNGATEVKSWSIVAGDSEEELNNSSGETVAWVPRSGFETTVEIGRQKAMFFQAVAMDSEKKIIGSSGIFNMTDRILYGGQSEPSPIPDLGVLGDTPADDGHEDSEPEDEEQDKGEDHQVEEEVEEDENEGSHEHEMQMTTITDLPGSWRLVFGIATAVGLIWALVTAWRM